tara:strand:+ start:2087 stop:2566 length:480 start_codon:yes stop_codon:yes gene_type:complete
MEVIKNFLEEEAFNVLEKELTDFNKIPFYFRPYVASEEEIDKDFYFTHTIYENHQPNSDLFVLLTPILTKLSIKGLIRIKLNLYPRTEKLLNHNPHKDYDYKHKGCIYSLNTCNGFTVLGDTKVPSIANQALLFDPSIDHNSTTCTDKQARININFNYT